MLKLTLFINSMSSIKLDVPKGSVLPEYVEHDGRYYSRQYGWAPDTVNYYPIAQRPYMKATPWSMIGTSLVNLPTSEPSSTAAECTCSSQDLFWNGCRCSYSRTKRAGGYRDPSPIA
jgi:hypothetical protein